MTTDIPAAPLDGYGFHGEAITEREAAMVMVRIQRIRREAIQEYIQLGKDAAARKRDAAKAKARHQLESRMNTVEDRKADAVLKSADDAYEAEVADVLVDACKKSLFVLADDWDTARSITANERAKTSATEGFGS